jgi:hypothetical protein
MTSCIASRRDRGVLCIRLFGDRLHTVGTNLVQTPDKTPRLHAAPIMPVQSRRSKLTVDKARPATASPNASPPPRHTASYRQSALVGCVTIPYVTIPNVITTLLTDADSVAVRNRNRGWCVMSFRRTTELTDAGGQWRPNWELTRPARVRSSDLVSHFVPVSL